MKDKVLTALELFYLVKDLEFLIDSKVNKIYQPKSKELVFLLYKRGKGQFILKINSGQGLYLSEYKLDQPQPTKGFGMALRKYLHNALLRDVRQHGIERVVELEFYTKGQTYILLVELFSKGNFVLLDKDMKIIDCAAKKTFKQRIVKPGQIYKYPPSGIDPQEVKFEEFEHLFHKVDKDLVKFLAVDLGLGGQFAEGVCASAGVSKGKHQSFEDLQKVHSEVLNLFKRKLEPKLVYKDEVLVDVIPFDTGAYDANYKKVDFESFNKGLDFYFSQRIETEAKAEGRETFEGRREKLLKTLEKQRTLLVTNREEYARLKEAGDFIYKNFGEVKDAISKGKKEFSGIVLNPRLNVQKNAEEYYEKAKSYKYKIAGSEGAANQAERRLKALEAEGPKDTPKVLKKVIKVERKWYEKFHWFYTSSGFLAIGGRDATQNDIVVKKHLDKGDVIFHSTLIGSPFFVIKNPTGKRIPDQDLKEVAIATASYSRAWRQGLGAVEVYWVKPEQIDKRAVKKGAFVITGKKNLMRAELGLTIGITDKGIEGGPESAISKRGKWCAKVRIGELKKTDAAKKMLNLLKLPKEKLDDVVAVLPNGKMNVTS